MLQKSSKMSQLCNENNLNADDQCIQRILINAMKIISKNNDQVYSGILDTETAKSYTFINHKVNTTDSKGLSIQYLDNHLMGLIDDLKISEFSSDLNNLTIKFDTFSSKMVFFGA